MSAASEAGLGMADGSGLSTSTGETVGGPSTVTDASLPQLHFPQRVQAALQEKQRGSDAVAPSDDAVIIGIAVVDFNHLVGPQVEYAHPKELSEDEELCSTLPFLALPDGSHMSDEDFCYFHVIAKKLHPTTIFGISCNRQIASDKLTVRGKEVTRSTVQKAVIVLARDPVFGPIKEKLGIVTRAFFAQGNFGDNDILIDFHATLEAGLRSARGARADAAEELSQTEPQTNKNGTEEKAPIDSSIREREAVMYMGTSVRELIFKWRFKTLMLLKALLLQKKIMFFGYPVERLCTYQYSLISLIPDLLFQLKDAGSPSFDTQSDARKKPESLKTSDRKSLMEFMGLPLHLFGQDSLFQPYLPLQQLEQASHCKSFLIGTTNSIFRQQKECEIDIVVDLEHSSLEFADPSVQSCVSLTPADRKWMDEIVHVVLESWNASDPTRPLNMQYLGSDDYLRSKFEEYICSLLSSIKYADYVEKQEAGHESIVAPDAASTSAFGADFIEDFKKTQAFGLWDRTTDSMVFDLFEHKHPCDGKTSTLEDVSLRLTSGIYDLHLDEHLAKNLAPTREMLGNALNQGSTTAWRYANKWGSDIARFRREQMAAIAARQESKGSNIADSDTPRDKSGELHSPSQGIHHVSKSKDTLATPVPGTHPSAVPHSGASFLTPAQQQAAQEFQRQASAAAMHAGTQVRSAFGNFGSFLAARQKSWSGTTSAEANPAPNPSLNSGETKADFSSAESTTRKVKDQSSSTTSKQDASTTEEKPS